MGPAMQRLVEIGLWSAAAKLLVALVALILAR
jgi:hypothetical protein